MTDGQELVAEENMCACGNLKPPKERYCRLCATTMALAAAGVRIVELEIERDGLIHRLQQAGLSIFPNREKRQIQENQGG